MNKIKIIFYGNCQLCVVSNYIEKFFPDQFDVISCKSCGLEYFTRRSKTFCVWKRGHNRNSQLEYANRIHRKIKEADVFVFHDHGGNNTENSLMTKYLQDEIAKKNNTRCIAVHNYNETDIYPEPVWMIKYAISKGITKSKEIDSFLRESNDSYFAEYMNDSFKKSRIQNKKWKDRANSTYDDYISMNDFIAEKYNKKILSHNHLHPTEHYFAEFTTRILNKFNLKFDENTICGFEQPAYFGKAKEYDFFNKAFPDIVNYSCVENADLSLEQIDRFIREKALI